MNPISTQALYSQINAGREILCDIMKLAENLKEIAMGASINANHAGKSIRIFTEIAHQMHKTGFKVANFAFSAREEMDSATNTILEIIKYEACLEKYKQVLPVIDIKSRKILLLSINILDSSIKNKIFLILKKMSISQSFLERIYQMQNRLFGIVNSLKIECLPLSGDALSSIASLSSRLEFLQIENLKKADEVSILLKYAQKLSRHFSVHRR